MADETYPGFGGQACCILELCCGGERQVDAVTEFLLERVKTLNKQTAHDAAVELCEAFDFATKGTLAPFKNDIIKYVLAYTEEVRKYHEIP